MKKEYEFKVVKITMTVEEEGEKFSIILKPVNRLTVCELELKVKTEDVFVAQDELGFGLDMGDTVCFEKSKTGKQLKIAPTPEDLKKTTPDPASKKKGRPKKVNE